MEWRSALRVHTLPADSVRLSHAPLGQVAARRLSILGVLVLTPPCGRSNAALAARGHDAAGCLAAGVAALEASGAGLIIVHCGACRRTVAHHAVISARRAASSFVGMGAETVSGARAPAARRSAGW